MSNEEFTKVSYRRKLRPQQVSSSDIIEKLSSLSLNSTFNKDIAIKRILEAKDHIASSDYYSNVKASIREALSLLQNANETLTELVCFGIGHIGDCMISRYQLAFILVLQTELNFKKKKICDPILSNEEISLLEHFDFEIITKNIEAKYTVTDYTFFYLPHCPKQLSNNLLWANWSFSLEKCIILSNTFAGLIESNSKQSLLENAEYILKVSPFVKEIAIINTFCYFEIFNDSAIHVFPNLNLLPEDFWLTSLEPKYSEKDIEYIAQN